MGSIKVEEKKEIEAEFPIEGMLYFHNDGSDAVEAQPHFSDLEKVKDNERFREAYDGLRSFMYEVEIKVAVHKDGNVEVLEVDGQPVK